MFFLHGDDRGYFHWVSCYKLIVHSSAGIRISSNRIPVLKDPPWPACLTASTVSQVCRYKQHIITLYGVLTCYIQIECNGIEPATTSQPIVEWDS